MTTQPKGIYLGPCNRTACQKPGATFYNKSTEAWYCEECAREINHVSPADSLYLYDTPLLCEEMTPEEVDAWSDARVKARTEEQRFLRDLPDLPVYSFADIYHAKGSTPNRYTPHQGSREMARRKKKQGVN